MKRPDATAIVFAERRLSFGEWDRQASRFGRGLQERGVRKGDRVALFLPNCLEYEIAFFGCARIGAVVSPLNPSYKEREVRYQLEDSAPAAIVVHQTLLPILGDIPASVPSIKSVIVVGDPGDRDAISFTAVGEDQPDTPPQVDLADDDLVALPYSSGTTGLAKGVMLTQRNLVCNATQFVAGTQTSQRDTLLIFLPLFHIYGVALMATAVAGGATQVLMPRFDLEEALRNVEQERVTELYVVPPIMLTLCDTPDLRPEQFQSVRFIKSAAAPLSPDVAKRVRDRLDVRVIQAYGMTESSPMTHVHPLDTPDFPIESVGAVAADTECRIMDLNRGTRICAAGEVGEVTVRGPQVMSGYWNAPLETANALRDGWLYTGDIGYEDKNGNLYIVDRKKEMIKYKAFSVAPAELEAVLLEHPAITDCAVTAQPDPEAGEVPRAFVVIRDGQPILPEEILEFVRRRVAGYKQIRAIEIVDTIPRTPSGKILRRVLKERARAAAPQTLRTSSRSNSNS